jgi:hypothetical protein
VQDEELGDFTAPEQQDARRDGPPARGGSSQYDADAGSSSPGAEHYPRSGNGSASSGGGSSRGSAASSSGYRANGSEGTNKQSSQRAGAGGRLWEGTSPDATQPNPEEGQQQQREKFQHVSVQQRRKGAAPPSKPGADSGDGEGDQSPGRQVGDIMRRLIEEEGWQLVVEGHR